MTQMLHVVIMIFTLYLPGSVQWMDGVCLPISYPLKELSASRPLYTVCEMHFTM